METIKTQNSVRSINSLGMFDMLKGIGMVLVVVAHTIELYEFNVNVGTSFSTVIIFIYREALMSAFFIASGYGFRQISIRKCLKQQRKTIMLPYIYTAIGTTLLHMLLHYGFFKNIQSAIKESVRVLSGFAFGLPHTAVYFGVKIFSCGPMWYLLTLTMGWIILDVVLELVPRKSHTLAVLLVMILGWICCATTEMPFCISQGMAVVPYLYAGYQAKRNKIFEKKLPKWFWIMCAISVIAIASGSLYFQTTDSLSRGEWVLGPVSILLDGTIGFSAVYMFTRWNRQANLFTNLLENIGRYSLIVFCLHTVELSAVPWYLLVSRFSNRPVVGMALQLAIRTAFITIMHFVVRLIDSGLRKLKRRKRAERCTC